MNKYFVLLILTLCCASSFAQEVTHTSTAQSLSAENTKLEIEALYNNPKAIVVAIPLDETKHLLKSPIGVWNNGVNCYLFNEDRSPMANNIKFKVIYTPKPDSAHFQFQATRYTLKGNVAYIDKPVLNENPSAIIMASMSEGPSGVYNRSAIAFKYDEEVKKWYVFNIDKTPIPQDLGIYIIVKKPE